MNPMPHDEGRSLPAACRAFLATLGCDEASAHEAVCPHCAARAARVRRATTALAAPPRAPAMLHEPRFAQAVLERIVEHAAEAPVFHQLALPVLPPAADALCPEPLLASPIAHKAIAAPAGPSAAAWHRVHDAILADLRQPRRLRVRRRWLAAVAAAALVAAVFSRSNRGGPDAVVDIAFIDLDRAPSLEFTAIRHGALR